MKTLLLLIIPVLLFSCSNTRKFNSEEWKTPTEFSYENRLEMVDDLIESKILIGKNKKQVVDLLGENEFGEMSADTFGYTAYTDYAYDIDPVEVHNLHIYFIPNSTVKSVELKKWEH